MISATNSGDEPIVKFSIVTPTLNAKRFLDACLASVEAQRCPGIEVEHLFLDGGSTDGTVERLQNANVTMLDRRPSDGLVKAMCLGYEHATGDLIGYLGADDVFLPGALALVAKTFRSKKADVIIGGVRWTNESLESRGELSPIPQWITGAMHASLGWNYVGAANTFVSPKLYKSMGGFRCDFTKAEDYEFYTRVLSKRVPVARVHQPICCFRRHGDNSSLEHDNRYFSDVERVMSEYGPSSRLQRFLYRNAVKSWIYLAHPSWAYHQIRSKLGQRSLRGTS